MGDAPIYKVSYSNHKILIIKTAIKLTGWRNRGNGVAQCTTNIGCPSRVKQNAPTTITHKLALHSCKS